MRTGKSHDYAKHARKKHVRASSLKSMGKLMKARKIGLNPMTAMQQMHLLSQEKGFLQKQIIIFESKIGNIKDKIVELDEKIASYKQNTVFPSSDTTVDAKKRTNVRRNKTTRRPDDADTMTLNY